MSNFACARCGKIANTANTTYWFRGSEDPALCVRCDPPTRERLKEMQERKHATPVKKEKEK